MQLYAQQPKHEIGLGFVLGNPCGLSAKMWTTQRTSVAATAGYQFWGIDHIYMSADFLVHPWILPHEEDLIHIYMGAGLGIGFHSDLGVDVRVPFGLSLYPDSGPLEIFTELVPALDLVGPDGVKMRFIGYLGTRWYF